MVARNFLLLPCVPEIGRYGSKATKGKTRLNNSKNSKN